MAVAIPNKDDVFHSDNIIVGFAEVKSRTINGVVQWELPGGEFTHSKLQATEYAERLDKMIQTNMKRFNRSLLWS